MDRYEFEHAFSERVHVICKLHPGMRCEFIEAAMYYLSARLPKTALDLDDAEIMNEAIRIRHEAVDMRQKADAGYDEMAKQVAKEWSELG